MYLKRLYLKNVRCFDELSLDLTAEGGSRNWVLLLGENGTGKTTILRSIAMGLCDETAASGLLSELTGDMIRDGCNEAVIKVELAHPDSATPLTIETRITATSSGEPAVEQQTTPSESFPWERIFVCGYGSARRAVGREGYKRYRTIDAVYSLFNYDTSLQNADVPFLLLERQGIDVADLYRRIERVLRLPQGSIRLDDRAGINISGPWQTSVPLGALGDGYATTFAWIADLVGWAMLYQNTSFGVDLPGIILLDGLEQHLHPAWQRRIVKQLRDQFPVLQFIATTHAPMCAIGATDLDDTDCELIVLQHDEGRVTAIEDQKPPRGRRADQVLTSYLFGLDTTSDSKTREQIQRFAYLSHKKQRSQAEEEELSQLRQALDAVLGTGETELERAVAIAVREVLSTSPRITEFPTEAIGYEIKRKLRSLLAGELSH